MKPQKNIRLEVMQQLESKVDGFIDQFLIPVEEIWQPTDFLPNSQGDQFFDEIKEIRELAKELPYDFWVVLVVQLGLDGFVIGQVKKIATETRSTSIYIFLVG